MASFLPARTRQVAVVMGVSIWTSSVGRFLVAS